MPTPIQLPLQIYAFDAFKKCLELPPDSKKGIECRVKKLTLYKTLIQLNINTTNR